MISLVYGDYGRPKGPRRAKKCSGALGGRKFVKKEGYLPWRPWARRFRASRMTALRQQALPTLRKEAAFEITATCACARPCSPESETRARRAPKSTARRAGDTALRIGERLLHVIARGGA